MRALSISFAIVSLCVYLAGCDSDNAISTGGGTDSGSATDSDSITECLSLCTEELDAPVCGTDGNTYHRCSADCEGISIAYDGECETGEDSRTGDATSTSGQGDADAGSGSEDAGADTSDAGPVGDAVVSCVPDEEQDCTCDDGSEGVRHCNDEGDGYGPCYCTGTAPGGWDATSTTGQSPEDVVSSSGVGTTADAGPVGDAVVSCVPDEEQDCTCDDGSEGVRHCNDEGDGYGPCYCTSTAPGGGDATSTTGQSPEDAGPVVAVDGGSSSGSGSAVDAGPTDN